MTANNRAVDLLRDAKELISTPDRWCQVHATADAKGVPYTFHYPVPETGPVRRCAHNAIHFAEKNGRYTREACSIAVECLDIASGRNNFIYFNDDPTTTHAQVMQMFDKAIELVFKGEGKDGSD